ncbi:MAG: hypothetical protein DMG57_15825 [Acidobacteria bacterium]|nr:MAG: hypothetical protein DMG57_15825 [Acidobacteriota bacterium]
MHTLIAVGLVREVRLEGKSVRFDANTMRHHHFVCEHCNRVEDISWFDVPSLARRSQLGTRTVRDHEIVFRGICEVCSSE